jgi:dihydroneopterin aldolase
MDRIFLNALTTECIVGIWDWERQVKQTVVIDLEMAIDVRKAAATDHIDSTLDYKKVSKRILAFVGESQFQLVETLTEKIAELIIVEFNVSWAKVTLNKRGAIRSARDVGIVIERSTADYPQVSG